MPKPAKSNADLIIALQQLLENKTVGTQEEIKATLQKKGYLVNQVKISRILHKIGAIKINEGDQVVYRLPTELVPISPNDPLKNLILNITHNESLIIIKTAPSCAHFVARFLDQTKKNIGILGTVSGDDTIFVAPETVKKIKQTHQKIYDFLLK